MSSIVAQITGQKSTVDRFLDEVNLSGRSGQPLSEVEAIYRRYNLICESENDRRELALCKTIAESLHNASKLQAGLVKLLSKEASFRGMSDNDIWNLIGKEGFSVIRSTLDALGVPTKENANVYDIADDKIDEVNHQLLGLMRMFATSNLEKSKGAKL